MRWAARRPVISSQREQDQEEEEVEEVQGREKRRRRRTRHGPTRRGRSRDRTTVTLSNMSWTPGLESEKKHFLKSFMNFL